MNKRVEATVSGYVQGVSFRYYTLLEARRLRLTGWVANQYDGTVKVVGEGPQDSLEDLLRFLAQGPRLARVDHVQADWFDATNEFYDFSVRRL